ncbi:MAG: LamG domain-containing protein, partial [bacterium]|nr:LamG domain-containing protein [bacterium]
TMNSKVLRDLAIIITTLGFFGVVGATLAGGLFSTTIVGIDDGLVAHWTFDGPDVDWGTGIVTDTAGANNGSMSGIATSTGPVGGPMGQGLEFDGVDDYVDAGNMGSFPSAGAISFWMNPSVVVDNNNAFDTANNANTGIRFEEASTGSFKVVIAYVGASDIHTYLASGLAVGVWRHVTLTWNTGTNTVVGYLDGLQVFSESQTNWPTTLPAVTIGAGLTRSRLWNGSLDDVRIYNRALSTDEVNQLYQLGR